MMRPNWVHAGDAIEIFGYKGMVGRTKDGDEVWHVTGYSDVTPWDVVSYILGRAPQRVSKVVVISPQVAVQLYLRGELPKERLETATQTPETIHCLGVKLAGADFQVIIDRRLEKTPNRIS